MTRAFSMVLFLACMAFTYKSSFLAFGQQVADATRWSLLAAGALFALWAPRPLKGAFSGTAVRLAGYSFAGFALLSSIWSSQKSIYSFMRGGSMVLLAMLVFGALWPRLRRVSDYERLTKVLSSVAWITVIVSAFFYVFMRGSTVRPVTGAFQGLFGNPNSIGMVYAVLMPVSLSRFYLKKRPLRAALPVILSFFVIWSQSRAGLVGCLFGSLIFFASYYGRKMWILAVLAFFVLVPYGAVQQGKGVVDDVEQNFLRGETSLEEFGSGRYGLWMLAFDRFQKRPFVGYGFGTGGDLYLPSGEPFRYHSSFSQITVELGIVGLMFFVAPIAYGGLKAARYQLAPANDPRVRAVLAALMGGWLGGAVNSFFESWLFSVGNIASLLAWICFAGGVKAMSEARSLDQQQKEKSHARGV